ncbi:MAG: ATP-dependent helicase [bacterium]
MMGREFTVQTIDFEKALNPEQLVAVTAPDGPLFVLAAAGTGKTRTLVYRVAYLVQNGVIADRILLLTFTNKAASEMLERARALVGPGISGMWGGTFHHMANRMLRRHAASVGFRPDFTILDRDDSKSMVADCVKKLNLTHEEFPKKEVLLSLFSSAANTEMPLGRIVERRFADIDVDAGDIIKVWEGYEARKKAMGAMDFDDLLVNCLRLFRDDGHVRELYQSKFQHVLVDEYQDTNTIQAQLVDYIAAKHRNILVVGDDFQSIYAWRGANFRNIMSFPKRYADARTCKLETNYRSVPEILAVANACIAGNPDQFQKTLRATREASKKPSVVQVRDGDEQARYVAGQIRQLRRAGYKLSDIAVLYRAHFHAMELQMALTRERLPFVITSGVRFFEQAHIKDVCSILRILENPFDEVSFARLLRMMPGVGEKTAAGIWQKLGCKFDAQDAGARKQLCALLRPASLAVWKDIEPVLADYKPEGLNEDGGEVIHRFAKAFYEKHCANIFEDFDRRLEEIDELVLYTADFGSVQEFLSDVALLTNLDSEVEKMAEEAQDSIRLTTVHQAKGLEWPVVIVLWATDGMFPSSRALAETDGGEAEERRLFYVAVTRAKDELFLCVPEVRRTRDGGVIFCQPSRFVEELPPGLVATLRPVPY